MMVMRMTMTMKLRIIMMMTMMIMMVIMTIKMMMMMMKVIMTMMMMMTFKLAVTNISLACVKPNLWWCPPMAVTVTKLQFCHLVGAITTRDNKVTARDFSL